MKMGAAPLILSLSIPSADAKIRQFSVFKNTVADPLEPVEDSGSGRKERRYEFRKFRMFRKFSTF